MHIHAHAHALIGTCTINRAELSASRELNVSNFSLSSRSETGIRWGSISGLTLDLSAAALPFCASATPSSLASSGVDRILVCTYTHIRTCLYHGGSSTVRLCAL